MNPNSILLGTHEVAECLRHLMLERVEYLFRSDFPCLRACMLHHLVTFAMELSCVGRKAVMMLFRLQKSYMFIRFRFDCRRASCSRENMCQAELSGRTAWLSLRGLIVGSCVPNWAELDVRCTLCAHNAADGCEVVWQKEPRISAG